jgi:hypothetical protein
VCSPLWVVRALSLLLYYPAILTAARGRSCIFFFGDKNSGFRMPSIKSTNCESSPLSFPSLLPPYSNAAIDDAAANVLISTTPTLAAGTLLIPFSLAIGHNACVIVGFLLRGIVRPNTSGRIDVCVRICEHEGTATERARLDEMTNLRLVVGGMGHPRGGAGGRGVDNVGWHAKRRQTSTREFFGFGGQHL